MADKKSKPATEEVGEPKPHTPEDERELTERAEEAASSPEATGQEHEEI